MTDTMDQGSHQRGSSGASIALGIWQAIKSSDDPIISARIVKQGEWLSTNVSPSVPLVYSIFENGYAMERLTLLPSSKILNGNALMQYAVDALHRDVWSLPAVVDFDRAAHEYKMHPLVEQFILDPVLRKIFKSACDDVRWDELTRCLSHGDPTYDNMMIRDENELVIIDPIPAVPAVPDLLAVDIGKMLQSSYGFEYARYGDPHRRLSPSAPTPMIDYLVKKTGDGRAEWAAAKYWHIVHLLRAMPYVSKETQIVLTKQLTSALCRL